MTNRVRGPFQVLPNCRLWLALDHISRNADEPVMHRELAEALLTTQDLNRWNRYRPLEKKRQFLNSRLALRAVINSEFGTDADSVIVATTDSGQPLIQHCRRGQVASISLSHTDGITAIALADSRYGLGVDIEAVQPLDVRTFSLAVINEMEHEWLSEAALREDPDALLAIWTLKEASWKALGGPRDTSVAEIVAEYRNSHLSSQLHNYKEPKKPGASHFFGQHYAFPRALTNYSLICSPGFETKGFVGCVVVVDPDLLEGQAGTAESPPCRLR